MSSGHATLQQLQTTLGVRDLYDLVEIITVDAHNARVVQKISKEKQR